jgi:hypothetical protein
LTDTHQYLAVETAIENLKPKALDYYLKFIFFVHIFGSQLTLFSQALIFDKLQNFNQDSLRLLASIFIISC